MSNIFEDYHVYGRPRNGNAYKVTSNGEIIMDKHAAIVNLIRKAKSALELVGDSEFHPDGSDGAYQGLKDALDTIDTFYPNIQADWQPKHEEEE